MKEMGRGSREKDKERERERAEIERPEKFLGWKTSTRTLIEQFKAMPSNSVRTFFAKLNIVCFDKVNVKKRGRKMSI